MKCFQKEWYRNSFRFFGYHTYYLNGFIFLYLSSVSCLFSTVDYVYSFYGKRFVGEGGQSEQIHTWQ